MKSKEQYTEEDEKALRDLQSAIDAVRKVAGGKAGDAAEKKYGEAYQRCYALGLKQYPMKICTTTR